MGLRYTASMALALTLGLLTGIVASLALELNAHETPEALRWLGFRSAPVVSRNCVAPSRGLPPGSRPRFSPRTMRSSPMESMS